MRGSLISVIICIMAGMMTLHPLNFIGNCLALFGAFLIGYFLSPCWEWKR